MELRRSKNVATYIVVPIVDADGDIVTGAAGLDSELNYWDDGNAPQSTFTDCTNEATEIGSTGVYYLSLTQAEMNHDYVYVIVKTSTAGAKTQHILINCKNQAADVTAVSGDATAADNLELMFDGTGYAAGDPWTAELPGDYDVGTAGALLPALAAALSALGAGSVVVTSPVAESGTVTLHAGDDYDPADGRGLLFTVADETHALHLDEAGCVVRFKSPQVTWSAASVSTTPAGYLVMFSLTHEQTSALSITRQLYELEATQADGDIITLATGTLVVVRDIPAVG